MVKDKRLYDVLGVEPFATQTQIKKAWHKAALMYHPDKPTGDAEKFKECEAAYKVLCDSDLRAHYDKTGQVDRKNVGIHDIDLDELFGGMFAGGMFGGTFGDPFGDPFGGGGGTRRRKMKCEPMTLEVRISLQEAFTGKKSKLVVTRQTLCSSCDGNGGTEPRTCLRCKGRGMCISQHQNGGMLFQTQHPCSDCKMDGKVYDKPCTVCKKEGTVRNQIFVDMDLPPGVADGYVLHFENKGNHLPGTNQGDIIVIIRIDAHPLFVRSGDTLNAKLTIDICTALIGGTTSIQGLDGNTLNIKIPKGRIIRPGDVLTIQNEGMPIQGAKNGERGDLQLTFTVAFPEDAWSLSADENTIRQIFSCYKVKG